ncbi:AlbA family DNA-binding domain-containing protein [Lysinibacillus fusiformis]|uniref:AlbA family DNA-binding domain-containing protein n=1 Tax=Lysinibacillus fusiformis TaxID=28031 RepID=UPI00263BB3D5|nr:RNA-binding domain-containing protein [Lysinibacillus fusiformis]MDC6266643.1 putative DNA binding domain-containing protein [Lysinibacillus sphaericus]MDN4970518.1 putative DNA binding domain-containing protein [Lysinibacillus fusiformis]
MITESKIQEYLRTLRNGGIIENPKLELKKEWWNLHEELGISEFIKDTTALANTFGGNGFIIIGIDEKTGEVFDSPFPANNKINDPTKLGNIIYSKVQEPFTAEFYSYTIENKNLVVVEIRESFNKPHIIKNHKTSKKEIQNYIPIRKSTGTYPADKFDLDLMYSNRNMSIPNYKLDLFIPKVTQTFEQTYNSKRGFAINVSILNSGQRTNIVTSGEITIFKDNEAKFKFEMKQFLCKTDETNGWKNMNKQEYIILQPNEIRNLSIGFFVPEDQAPEFFLDHRRGLKNYQLQLSINDVKNIPCISDLFTAKKNII